MPFVPEVLTRSPTVVGEVLYGIWMRRGGQWRIWIQRVKWWTIVDARDKKWTGGVWNISAGPYLTPQFDPYVTTGLRFHYYNTSRIRYTYMHFWGEWCMILRKFWFSLGEAGSVTAKWGSDLSNFCMKDLRAWNKKNILLTLLLHIKHVI